MIFPSIRRFSLAVVALGVSLAMGMAQTPRAEAAAITFASQTTTVKKPLVFNGGNLSVNPVSLPVTFFFTEDVLSGALGPLGNGAVAGVEYDAIATLFFPQNGNASLSGQGIAQPLGTGYIEYKPAASSGLNTSLILLRTDITLLPLGEFDFTATKGGFAGGFDATDSLGAGLLVQFYSDFLPGVNQPAGSGFAQNAALSVVSSAKPFDVSGTKIVNTTMDFGTNFAIEGSVPEPGTLALLCGLGVSGSLLAVRRRRK